MVFFQKVLYSKDQILIRETCLFISHLLRNQEKIKQFEYIPDYLEEKTFIQKNIDYLYSSVYLLFKRGLKNVKNLSVISTQEIQKDDDYFSDYEKFKLGLNASFNVAELLQEFKKLKQILKNILTKEKNLKKEIKGFQLIANDNNLKEIFGDNTGTFDNKNLKENIQNLVNFTHFFNETAFSHVLYILQSFINDIKTVMVKLNTEKNFEKCKESLVAFVLGYDPVTKRLKKYCQCLINGAN